MALVDDAGEPVAAKGEYRGTGFNHDYVASFDCSIGQDDSYQYMACTDGVLSASSPGGTNSKDEIRFQLPNGEFAEWQPVPLVITTHTDPDFNGPGCSCSWETATAKPVVVPAEARPAP